MLMNKPNPQSDSALRLIIAAVGLYVLAMMPSIVVGLLEGAHLALTRRELSSEYLLNALAYAAGDGIMLSAAFLRGRALGEGDACAGLGDGPISNRPIIALMAVLLGAYTMLTDIGVPRSMDKLFIIANSPWWRLYRISISVTLTPLAEELFFRGWLWTGLRRHWGALPTAALTSALFLGAHWTAGFLSLVLIFPLTVALATARHLGRSVRASIAVHMLYNLSLPISPLVLKHFGLI
jgi:membrane protease YdiL (CAAX protease family)